METAGGVFCDGGRQGQRGSVTGDVNGGKVSAYVSSRYISFILAGGCRLHQRRAGIVREISRAEARDKNLSVEGGGGDESEKESESVFHGRLVMQLTQKVAL